MDLSIAMLYETVLILKNTTDFILIVYMHRCVKDSRSDCTKSSAMMLDVTGTVMNAEEDLTVLIENIKYTFVYSKIV